MLQRTGADSFRWALLAILATTAAGLLGFILFFNSLIQEFVTLGNTQRKDDLAQVVRVARSAIEPILADVRAGRLDRDQALDRVRALVRTMTYTDQYGPNYVFMSGYDGTMLVQPFEPAKEMTNQLGLRDAYGNPIIGMLIDMARSSAGQGYVIYHYPPPKSDRPEAKLAFVIGIPELSCYIGTGQYMRQAQATQQRLLQTARSLVIGLMLLLLIPVLVAIGALRQRNRAMAQEILVRAEAETALRESEERYRELVEYADVVVVRWDPSGTLRFANGFAARLFGYTKEDLIGRPLVGTIVPSVDSSGNDLARMIDEIGRAPERYSYHENENITSDGRRLWVRWNNRAIRTGSGALQGVLSIGSDITEQKAADAALRASESRFRLLFEMAPLPLAYVARDGRVIETNQRFESLIGYRHSDVPTLDAWWPLAYPDPEYRTHVMETWLAATERAMATGQDIEPAEYNVACGDGVVRSMIVGASPLGDSLVITFTDVTEQKALQTQLLQAQKMEAVGQLAGGVAHDFNNMLQAILGYLDLVRRDHDLGAHTRQCLDEVRNAAERSADLTRQLLAFARKQTIVPVALNLNDSVDGMLKMLRRLIGESIELVWHPEPRLWSTRIDPVQVDQILANLCVNARDAIGSAGRIMIETRNEVLEQGEHLASPDAAPGRYVILAVTDNGCGMDKEALAKVFEPFYTTKAAGHGTGLGLATVYGIVKQNGGFVAVRSEPGQGTTFLVHLPWHEEQAVKTAQALPQDPPRGQGETILLVEDEPAILKMGETMLEALGYQVLTANTPSRAMALAAQASQRIDLVLTDVVMPEMDGQALAREIAAARPAARCVFMSGYVPGASEHGVVFDGSTLFIQKPFSIEDLATKIHAALHPELA